MNQFGNPHLSQEGDNLVSLNQDFAKLIFCQWFGFFALEFFVYFLLFSNMLQIEREQLVQCMIAVFKQK